METQAIILSNVYFCVVFKVQQDGPQIIAKHSSQMASEIREWLAQNNYPRTGKYLRQRQGANLPDGYYIKPHFTDRYFRVHEDNLIQEVDRNLFDVPLLAPDSF